MKNKIICVRIAQRVLRTNTTADYTKFPFDRVYLSKVHLKPYFKQLFRYYLSMPLDAPLLDALNQLAITTKKETTVRRDDKRAEGVPQNSNNQGFRDLIQSPDDWVMVVPTHVKTRYQNAKRYTNPIGSELGYILSRALVPPYNAGVRLPQITLHTPHRTIPIICGVCKNNLDLHEGKCIPGRPSCKSKVRVNLRLDSYNSDTAAQSVEESGDVQ